MSLIQTRIQRAAPATAGGLLVEDATDIVAQRRGTNSQVFRIYDTFTDASNYARLSLSAVPSTYTITPQAAGTGSLRNLDLGAVGVTTTVRGTFASIGAASFSTTLNMVGGEVIRWSAGTAFFETTGVNTFNFRPNSSLQLTISTTGITVAGAIEIDGALNHDGTTVGFYGTTPITQQTGVAVSAAGVHAACVALGLFTA